MRTAAKDAVLLPRTMELLANPANRGMLEQVQKMRLFLQWFQSRWHNPPKVVYMDRNVTDILGFVCAIY